MKFLRRFTQLFIAGLASNTIVTNLFTDLPFANAMFVEVCISGLIFIMLLNYEGNDKKVKHTGNTYKMEK